MYSIAFAQRRTEPGSLSVQRALKWLSQETLTTSTAAPGKVESDTDSTGSHRQQSHRRRLGLSAGGMSSLPELEGAVIEAHSSGLDRDGERVFADWDTGHIAGWLSY